MKQMKIVLTVVEFFVALVFLAMVVRASDEIQIQNRLTVTKGQLKTDINPSRTKFDMAGENISDLTQTFTPGATSLVSISSAITNRGVYMLQAMYTNNNYSVDFGAVDASTNLYRTIRLKAMESHVGRFHPTNLLYGTSNAGTGIVRVVVIDN